MSSTIGEAARLDDRAAVLAHYEELAAAAEYPKLLVLLKEARAALPAEFCGTPLSLAGRIDDALGLTSTLISADRDLVWSRLPDGSWLWLRA